MTPQGRRLAADAWDRAAIRAWTARRCPRLPCEEVTLAAALGRVLAQVIVADGDVPPAPRAAWDGHAVRAAETAGTSAYNPLPIVAVSVAAGDPLPPGTDAVLPEEAVTETAGGIEASEPAPPGLGVERAGAELRAGDVAVHGGRVLAGQHLGLLASLGIAAVRVVRRPRVRVIAASAALRHGGITNADTPMLAALAVRDGAVVETMAPVLADERALAQALLLPGADLVLVSGGTSDVAVAALAEVGEVEAHGLAIRPGETAGLGHVGGVPVILLPGSPIACYAAYEIVAGSAVRSLGGRSPSWPYGLADLPLRRKLVSEIGSADLHRVRLTDDGGVVPIGGGTAGGLASASLADGFVVVPEGGEGYPAGATVTICLYGPAA